ncbi:hypothetical protein H4S01_004031 [Coemansia sp. RSA 2610]|nr:hypothetical protein H4S01_004031 [Coemansia sp. RSA 2610]
MGNEDAASNMRVPEAHARLQASEKLMGVSRRHQTNRLVQKASDNASSGGENGDKTNKEMDRYKVYPRAWEDEFLPFKGFADAGSQKRFEELPAKLQRRTRILLADWHDLQQREDLIRRIMEGKIEVAAPRSRVIYAVKVVSRERKLAEKDIDEVLASSGHPGLYLFAKPAVAVEESAEVDDELEVMRALRRHLKIPTFGMEGATHTDIIDYLEDFEMVAHELGCLSTGWRLLLLRNCQGDLQSHVRYLMSPETDWAMAKKQLYQRFVGSHYKMDLTIALLAMKPEPGEQQKQFTERVSTAYIKYIQVTDHRQNPLLYYVFYTQLTDATQKYVDERMLEKDEQTPTILSQIVKESPWGEAILVPKMTPRMNRPAKRADKWCELHRVFTHDTLECRALNR